MRGSVCGDRKLRGRTECETSTSADLFFCAACRRMKAICLAATWSLECNAFRDVCSADEPSVVPAV